MTTNSNERNDAQAVRAWLATLPADAMIPAAVLRLTAEPVKAAKPVRRERVTVPGTRTPSLPVAVSVPSLSPVQGVSKQEWLRAVSDCVALDSTDKGVATVIAGHVLASGETFIGRAALAKKARISERAVQRSLERLRGAGLLTTERQSENNRPRIVHRLTLKSGG